MTSQYQIKLQQFLQASTMTPGIYTPSDAVKGAEFSAVLAGDKPMILTGPSTDKNSFMQAQAFCQSKAFQAALKSLGVDQPLTAEKIKGSELDWPASCEAVVASESGVFERGDGEGDLMMLSLFPNRSLTILLCVNTELARIIDPSAPVMDDGLILADLAKDLPQILKFH